MTIPYRQQAYGQAVGTAPIPSFIFRDRDPTPSDTTPNYQLYQAWINTNTFAIWYLEAFIASSGTIVSQWRAVGPIVTMSRDPTSADYEFPIGQTWVNTSNGNYWVLVQISGVSATWTQISASSGSVLTIDGNTGTATPIAGVVNIVGEGTVSTSGSGNTLTISSSSLFSSQVVTSADNPVYLVPNTIYVAKGSSTVMFHLPATSDIGDFYKILGYGNLWQINQGAAQTIYIGITQTTAGFFGTMSATQNHDTVELICVTPSLEWQVSSMIGNPYIT